MKRYLYYSSLLAVFSEALVTRYIIDIKFFYFVVLTNLVILGVTGKLVVSKKLLLFYGYLVLSGLISIALSTNTPRLFLSQFAGISLVSFFFFNFFTLFKEDTERIFTDYTKICFYIAIIGIAMFLYGLAQGKIDPIRSVMLEPAHFATIVLPGYYYSLKNKAFPRYMWIVILVAIVLSGSSLGLLALGLSVVLIPNRIHIFKVAFMVGIVTFLFLGAYLLYDPLKLRVDDSVTAMRNKDLTGVNLSTFFLASNFFVALESFERNPVLGSGLGSHELSHDIFLQRLRGVKEFRPFFHINASDAASLFIRIFSELGLVGLILLTLFLLKKYVPYERNGDPSWNWMSRAVLLYFFCKLMREGHHFPPELYFFVFVYIFAWRNFKESKTISEI